jgi:hypothetical protein
MADTIYHLIPTDPYLIPPDYTYEPIVALLRPLAPEEHIEIYESDDPEFVDPGQNLEWISCPLCRGDLDMDTWSEMMHLAADIRFTNLIFRTDCCQQMVSLNELDYHMPAGLASFRISISQSNRPPGVAEMAALTTLLQVPAWRLVVQRL